MKTILVLGGAGYIGSHMVRLLLEAGYRPVVADNLCTGHRGAVRDAELRVGDLRDGEFLRELFGEFRFDGVIDFAAHSLVEESTREPLKYYGNNLEGCRTLLEVMRERDVERIVFSSSAAVYGEPIRQPISEDAATDPTNPYGATKLAIEGMLKWCARAYGIRSAALRYFNAAGADPAGGLGEDHDPETHLIPLTMQTALGQRPRMSIFGDDYPTRDGTCVRDYVHVADLAQAHLLALERLERESGSCVFNLGSGDGYSVREIIETARRVTGRNIPADVSGRRAGDPAVLVADIEKARRELGWMPRRGLEDILADAWAWHSSHPRGYQD